MLAVAAIIGPGVWNSILIIGLLGWPVPARLVRSRILSVRENEFIEASRALGASRWRTLFRHAMPNAIDVIVVAGTLAVANSILLEAGMSFLGLGVQPPTPSWGNLLSAANELNVLVDYPWQWIPAGVAIVLTVLSINLIGDGLRDALDPRAIA
jgi:peptide/nickel transport system permease protein